MTDTLQRYSPEVEAPVYFCCLEAMQNIAKYSGAASARIDVAVEDDDLRFEVTDDGKGFDPATTGYGTGVQGMIDRLEGMGGTLAIRSRPGAGTTVAGKVPQDATSRSVQAPG
jgi:signal transduction histidine kinase